MMKKILLMVALAASCIAANAQIAVERSKFFDNWYLGFGGGVTTPLSCDPMFPLNAAGNITLGKLCLCGLQISPREIGYMPTGIDGSNYLGIVCNLNGQ